ncbi:Predicted O-methyltransferase YrrM [Lachnospiraceae bacterium NE2001]|nr:Predicted O-methyltransferase YrrM [Lachnospiraceae bacterium NE2001]
MDYSRIRDFIISYTHDDEGLLKEIYDIAVADEVPIIRRETRDFLRVLLQMVKPQDVLEVGTAVGYSTLIMADTLNAIVSDWHIDTCELDESRIKTAEINFSKSSYDSSISLLRGDAAETLKNLSKSYDFIFIDAAKAQYMIYLEEAIRLSHSGTVIVTDNILAEGDVLESHFLVEKRDRTIHDRMREYLQTITNDARLETSILSVGDGLALSIVK